MAFKDKLRIAAVGDLHFRGQQGALQAAFADLSERADVLVLCGDLTDYGTVEEAQALARELSATVKIPMVGVLGNHDFEAGKQDEVRSILMSSGLILLDGEAHEILGVGFAGVKGFIGGYGKYTLGAWGEDWIKGIVREAINEALKLESALARLKTPHRIVCMHYSPVKETVIGEPEEIFPFLGSSRLEEPLLRHPISAVFHGHAHKGTLEGRLM